LAQTSSLDLVGRLMRALGALVVLARRARRGAAIARHPAHDRGGEDLGLAAHLPDVAVGLVGRLETFDRE
jgi:hypothetical protein